MACAVEVDRSLVTQCAMRARDFGEATNTKNQAATHGRRKTRGGALNISEVRRHVQQWRDLKARFDRVHRAGLDALRRKDYGRFGAAIVQERRLIDEQRALVRAAAAQLRQWKLNSRPRMRKD